MQNRIITEYEARLSQYGKNKAIASEYREFSKDWSYYKMIAELAGDDLLKFDAVLERSIEEVYTFLIYRAEKEPAVRAQIELERKLKKHGNN